MTQRTKIFADGTITKTDHVYRFCDAHVSLRWTVILYYPCARIRIYKQQRLVKRCLMRHILTPNFVLSSMRDDEKWKRDPFRR